MQLASRRVIFGLTAAAVLFASSSFGQTGQQPAPPTGGTPGAPGGNVPTPGNVPGTPPGRTPGQPQIGDPRERSPFPDQERPIFLSGKVVMQDGTAPTEPVLIERVCNAGSPRPEGYTDSKGRFHFQLGQNNSMLADASVSSMGDDMGGFGRSSQSGQRGFGPNRGFSERDLMGCELRASLPGHRSEVVNLSGRRVMDNPDVGTIILRRLASVEGVTTSVTNLMAPKDAKKAFEKGHGAIRKGKWADAQKELEKAVQIYPKYAGAWFDLGLAHEQQGRIEEARKAYSEALAADAKFVPPYLQLAGLFARESKWQEVADTTDQMLRLNPVDYPRAYLYNSIANLNMKKLDAAEKSAREGVKIDDYHRTPKLAHVLGVILAQKADFTGAAEQMKAYLKFAPNASDADFVKKQLAEVEALVANRGPAPPPQ